AERPGEEVLAERPLVEHELDVEGRRDRLLDRGELLRREAAPGKALMVDARGALKRPAPDRVLDDALDRLLRVAENAQALGHHAVDDLEIAAASELLEL